MSEERVVRVSGQCELTDEEIRVALTQLNEGKRYTDAEVVFSFAGGEMVQRGNITVRGSLTGPPSLQLGGRQGPLHW